MALGGLREVKKRSDRAAIPSDFVQIQRLRRQLSSVAVTRSCRPPRRRRKHCCWSCQCFHPYLMKYLVMICRGHVPVIGPKGDRGAPVNKDIKPFLLYFLPKGSSLNWHTMNVIVKGFHLAFKGMETEEIYDVLMEQLVATIKGYDPQYTEKVRLAVEAIENGLSTQKQFSFADVDRHLDFDCHRYIRLLGRLGFHLLAPKRPGPGA